MKLLSKYIDKKSAGTIALIAEDPEDMWHAYNLINIGDSIRSSTIRRVVNESSVGLTTTSRVHTTLKILVKSLDYDTHASVLRVKGTNLEENPFVKMGAYHTIDLELNKKFDITKSEWDSVSLDRIADACDPALNADLAAVVMQEGLAHVCLILSSMTLVKSKIDMPIPRKRKNLCSNHDKSMEKFFERIVQAINTHVNFDVIKACIIASPGFLKEQFFNYMMDYATKNLGQLKVLIDNRSRFILVHSASGFKHSLREIFEDQNLLPRLTDTKALGEVKALDQFYQMLKSEPNRAFYGFKHVQKANESDAIDTLLISDALFRSKELKERKQYVDMVDKVKENNGQVKIFSSLHVSGEQLMQLTGIAAILRFPMPDIEDELLSDSEDDSDDAKSNGDDKGAQANGFDAATNDTVTPKPSTLKPNSSNASFTSDQPPLKNPAVSTLVNAESSGGILHKTPSKSSLKSAAEPASASASGKSSPLPMATGKSSQQPKQQGGGKKSKTYNNYDDDQDYDYYDNYDDDDFI